MFEPIVTVSAFTIATFQQYDRPGVHSFARARADPVCDQETAQAFADSSFASCRLLYHSWRCVPSSRFGIRREFSTGERDKVYI